YRSEEDRAPLAGTGAPKPKTSASMVMVLPVVGSGRRLTMASVSRFRSATGNLRTRPMPVKVTACHVRRCNGGVPTLQRETTMWRGFFLRLWGGSEAGGGVSERAPGKIQKWGGGVGNSFVAALFVGRLLLFSRPLPLR